MVGEIKLRGDAGRLALKIGLIVATMYRDLEEHMAR